MTNHPTSRKLNMPISPNASAGEVAELLFEKVVKELADRSDVRTVEPGKRLFFPDGIQLIYLKVTVSGVTAEIKVAGEKAPSGVMLTDGTPRAES
jgi:hypothetical protein